MTNIVERLRQTHITDAGILLDEAADEIERLRRALDKVIADHQILDAKETINKAEIERLRAERDQAPGLPWLLEKILRDEIERLRVARRSWFWHGRLEGSLGGYLPPDGLLAGLLYRLGWLCRTKKR